MTTRWLTRWNGPGAGLLEALTAPTATARMPSSTVATIAVRRCSGAAINDSCPWRLRPPLSGGHPPTPGCPGVVGGHDHRLEARVAAGRATCERRVIHG